MVYFDLNIGFGDNPYTTSEIIEWLDKLFETDSLTKFRKHLGQYKGKTEPTLVVRTNTYDDLSVIVSKIAGLSALLNQESIAIKSDAFELLVYQPRFPEHKKIKFDNTYFHDFYQKETIEAE